MNRYSIHLDYHIWKRHIFTFFFYYKNTASYHLWPLLRFLVLHQLSYCTEGFVSLGVFLKAFLTTVKGFNIFLIVAVRNNMILERISVWENYLTRWTIRESPSERKRCLYKQHEERFLNHKACHKYLTDLVITYLNGY